MAEQLHLGDEDGIAAFRQAWDKALVKLETEINKPTFESFFRTARPLSLKDGKLTVAARGDLAVAFLNKSADAVRAALSEALGGPVEPAFVADTEQAPAPESQPQKEPAKAPAKSVVSPMSEPLNERLDFDSFVIGDCNRFAHAACMAVAKKPGKVFNPLFIYGGPGLGKTHLLHAIAHYVLTRLSGKEVAYLSGETFTSQFVASLRDRQSESFRTRHRKVDYWLLDDVQFLVSKERTKEEFFHTFNTLQQTGKQIVITSDSPPKDLKPIDDRLRSRFEAGLVADLAPPDLETRLAILQKKAESEDARVPDEVLMEIAALIQTDVRALEGALITVVAHGSLMRKRLTKAVARGLVERYLLQRRCSQISIDAILRLTGESFSVAVEDLTSASRKKEIVTPRHAAMYLCRELTAFPLEGIGKAFGGRNHATVVHACAHVKELLDEDGDFRNRVDRLAEELRAGRY
ncbi:MAG: chromosomal replication initiator protein DnaA [Armatimonadetes bacterium]|nr:chromosomal replication initiator protein DnaA [Armatimonadota bacterium]